jgi:hypothetical protein
MWQREKRLHPPFWVPTVPKQGAGAGRVMSVMGILRQSQTRRSARAHNLEYVAKPHVPIVPDAACLQRVDGCKWAGDEKGDIG